MPLTLEASHLDGVLVFVSQQYPDERGFFMESYRSDELAAFGITHPFLQDNHSGSTKGVLRGLHFQWDKPMAKLMRVTRGSALLIAVDIRFNSPHLGKHILIEASAENRRQVYAPPGFARGLLALSDFAEVQYKCSALYSPHGEGGIRFDDPDLAIPWPLKKPMLSPKDESAPSFRDWLNRPEAKVFST